MANQGNFAPGTKLAFSEYKNGRPVKTEYKVVRFLAGGGQADTYIVQKASFLGSNQKYCMKHVYGTFASNKSKYYRKLAAMAKFEPPAPNMTWPLAISSQTESGSFCFIMPFLEGYSESSRLISYVKRWNSKATHDEAQLNDPYYLPKLNEKDPNDPAGMTVKQRAEVIVQAANIIDAIHKAGYVFSDVSGKNFLYKTNRDGHVEVALIDTDGLLPSASASGHTYTLGMSGTAQYRAPEILLGKSPSVESDRHSLAVWAFRILCGSNPLDGKYTHSVEWSEDNVKQNFGVNPQFSISSRVNCASPAVFAHWQLLPEIVKKYFLLAFSAEALHHPAQRPTAELLEKCISAGYKLN